MENPPFRHGQIVTATLADGVTVRGVVSLVGWLPFPGIWSFEVLSDDGLKYATLGAGSGRRIVSLEAAADEALGAA